MPEIGKINRLTVKRLSERGAWLEDDAGKGVNLPKKFVTNDLRPGTAVDVFIYTDKADRLTATTKMPPAQRDEFAYLQVKDTTRHGAFLDWGPEKDLFVPFKEQMPKMRKGLSYLVYIYVDEKTGRLVASSRIHRFLQSASADLKKGDRVKLLIWKPSALGMNVIINNRYAGLIFKDDLHADLQPGDRANGFIKNIRPDNKIDVALHRPGPEAIAPNAQRILLKVRRNNGYLPLHDKSDPAEIKKQLHVSKKAFKKAIGILYKKKLIRIEDDGLYLTDKAK